jgi:hypothetical protein
LVFMKLCTDQRSCGFAARFAGVLQRRFDHGAQLALGDLAQFDVGAPGRFVGRDFGVAGPDAVDVAVEIILRADVLVQRFRVYAGDEGGTAGSLLGMQYGSGEGE